MQWIQIIGSFGFAIWPLAAPVAYVLIGGTAVGTVLTLAFLPALYAIWYRVSLVNGGGFIETAGNAASAGF